MMAAERGGILMLAEIAMRQALAHGRPKPAGPPPPQEGGRNTKASAESLLATAMPI
jgi:hypothetical protein